MMMASHNQFMDASLVDDGELVDLGGSWGYTSRCRIAEGNADVGH